MLLSERLSSRANRSTWCSMKALGLSRQLRLIGIAVLSGLNWYSPGKKIAAQKGGLPSIGGKLDFLAKKHNP